MPGRRPELRPLKRGALLSLLTWLLLVGPATAQETGTTGGRVSARTDLSLTRLAGAWIPQAGAEIALRVAPWIQVGGVGRVDLDHPTVQHHGSDVRVRFGYGGVRVAVQPMAERLPALVVSLLGGAGNVDVEETTIGGVVDSQNGAIVEPGVSFMRPLRGRLGLVASISWRFAFEFEGVAGVDPGELAGPALGIGLTFGPF